MKHRKLRIAWSVAWAIAGLLLIALAVRSYWVIDITGRGYFSPSETTLVSIISQHGAIAFHRRRLPDGEKLRGLTDQRTHHTANVKSDTGHFLWQNQNGEMWIQFPYWLPGSLIAAAAWIPWVGFNGKFSLRILLIATTLVAVALGLIVCTISS